MSIEELIHPDDTKALKVLMNIPALPQVMEKVFEYGYDEISWTENLTTNLRLSETQMPEIYNRLPPICERLGIPVPELYLQMSNIANSWTSGRKKVYIVLTLGLIRRVKGDALDAVLAHECGHILCQHVLYQTLANAIFSFGESFSDSLGGDKMDNLKKVVTPFILRRLKTDKSIINDLPEKVENELMVSLTPEQRVLYNKVVDEYEEALQRKEETGANPLTLAGSTIMKLKMVANHPSLYLGDGEYDEKKSGKFLLLKELCTTIHENREKVLVFTQFASIIPNLLALLSPVFGHDGEYIDGSTPPEKRTRIVDSFQSGEIPFLVISLKAGGTGLTLTEANNVIHFDRWWNPAVEDQATDRAYRIGQKKVVTVYKFIAEDTIEERISQILKEKTELAESVLGEVGGEVTSKLSPRELLSAMRYTRKI